jgi:uncharacterized tellurite resistance protein B-like protein
MHLQKSDAKILLRCMVAMASADDKLHPEEIEVISAVFEKLTGQPLDEALLHDLFKTEGNNRLSILDDSSFAATYSPELKRLIIKACYLVKIADRAVEQSEFDMMATIAAGVGVSETELSSLIRELTSASATPASGEYSW